MNGASRPTISPELALVEPRRPCRVPTFQIPLLPDESFRVVGTRDGYVGCSWPGCSWHFHPELQISHIIRAAGERVVGDNPQPIEAGEVVLLGPNVPHVWKYDHPAKGEAVDVLTVHFRKDLLGSEFLGKPELWDVRRLVSRSRQGLLFLGKTREQLGGMIVALGRLQHVCAYIARHFDQPIDRDSAAEVACLGPGAFSRFFKARTGSTFHDYVAAVRIGHACRLLLDAEALHHRDRPPLRLRRPQHLQPLAPPASQHDPDRVPSAHAGTRRRKSGPDSARKRFHPSQYLNVSSRSAHRPWGPQNPSCEFSPDMLRFRSQVTPARYASEGVGSASLARASGWCQARH